MLYFICFFIILVYLIVITLLNYGFNKVNEFKLQDLEPKTKFSIVVPFRNEANNLPHFLGSISKLNYPNSHFEVILVNDNSDDNSVEVIKNVLDTFRPKGQNAGTKMFKIMNSDRISDSPKKDAIATAIAIAKYDWIITTDADCILHKYWLDTLDEFIQTYKVKAVCGPVRFTGRASFFNRFQIIDTLSLQGATVGSFGLNKPILCNGANFAYRTDYFAKVDGFKDNDAIASGDDIFLLQKFLKNDPTSVKFLKSNKAVVTTLVAPNFKTYLQQRLRWASKAKHYQSTLPKLIGLLVFLSNLVIIVLLPISLLELISFKSAALLVFIKFSIDLLLIFKTARFLEQETVLLSYVFVSIMYPFISVYIAIKSLFGSYEWKGRAFKA